MSQRDIWVNIILDGTYDKLGNDDDDYLTNLLTTNSSSPLSFCLATIGHHPLQPLLHLNMFNVGKLLSREMILFIHFSVHFLASLKGLGIRFKSRVKYPVIRQLWDINWFYPIHFKNQNETHFPKEYYYYKYDMPLIITHISKPLGIKLCSVLIS